MEEQANLPQQGNAASDEGAGFFEMLAGLPPALQEYLLSDDISARRAAAYDAHALTKPEREEALYADLDVFFEQIPLTEFFANLGKALPSWAGNQDRLKKLACDILGRVFLPAAAFVGDVTAVIRSLGGDPASYPQVSLAARIVPYSQGAKEIAAALGVPGLQDDTQRRLANIVESYLRAVRTEKDVTALLMRSRKTGGLDMTEEQAKKAVADITRLSRLTKFEDPATAVPAAPAEQPKPEEPPAPRRLLPPEIARLYAGSEEEQREIAIRVRRLREVTANDSARLRDAFYEVLFPAEEKPVDAQYVVAGLVAVAEDGEIEDLLTEDERYRSLVRAYYEETVGGRSREAERGAFESNPAAPAAVNVLLQLLLRGFGGLSQNDSARFAVRLSNAVARAVGTRRFEALAAFSMKEGEFRWNDPILLA